MWTSFLFSGSSLPVNAGSLHEGDADGGGGAHEEFGRAGGSKEATAAREEMGSSLRGGLKYNSSFPFHKRG